MERVERSFSEIQRRLLDERLERMNKMYAIIERQRTNPNAGKGLDRVMAMTIGSFVKSAMQVYGHDIILRHALTTDAVEFERVRLGFCTSCDGEPNLVSVAEQQTGGVYLMCEKCKEEAAEGVEEGEPDVDGAN